MNQYCFLTSVYRNTVLEELIESIDSLLFQTLLPSQIVIVCDGEVNVEVGQYLAELESTNPDLYTVVRLEKNVGLGLALRAGTEYCRCEYIARIDTDDLCVPDRMERQIAILDADEELSVVGSNISEFMGVPTNIVAYRNVPEKHEDICEYLKKRCPLNHGAVTMRKSHLERSGGYLDWHYDEDSYLWARMYLAGCKFYNIQDNLVNFRINMETYRRRGGYKYYKSERDLFRFMKDNGIITFWEYQEAKFIRLVVQVLMPNKVRQWFFNRFARE